MVSVHGTLPPGYEIYFICVNGSWSSVVVNSKKLLIRMLLGLMHEPLNRHLRCKLRYRSVMPLWLEFCRFDLTSICEDGVGVYTGHSADVLLMRWFVGGRSHRTVFPIYLELLMIIKLISWICFLTALFLVVVSLMCSDLTAFYWAGFMAHELKLK